MCRLRGQCGLELLSSLNLRITSPPPPVEEIQVVRIAVDLRAVAVIINHEQAADREKLPLGGLTKNGQCGSTGLLSDRNGFGLAEGFPNRGWRALG